MSSPEHPRIGGEAIRITVRLLASYRRHLPQDHDNQAGYALYLGPDTSAGQLLDRLPIPSGDPYTFFVNGRHADREQVLQEDDVLTVFPAVGGG
jgi:molybdopterin converting factor small subunit